MVMNDRYHGRNSYIILIIVDIVVQKQRKEGFMLIIKSIITNMLTALYQPFWFAVMLTVFITFFYLYAYNPLDTGKGIKAAIRAWFHYFKTSSFFRCFFFLIFYTVMILIRTLLYRSIWLNPLQDVMGGWWIWKTNSSTGEITLTTECFENIALMLPFTILLLWTAKEKILKRVSVGCVLWASTKISFLFSLSIEMAQLFLRLGTFQLSDLFFNTLGGFLGGLIYWIGWKVKSQE